MATDFRSLLATFQAATGVNTEGKNTNNDAKSEVNNDEKKSKVPLTELIDRMWRVTQIKAAAATAAAPKQQQGTEQKQKQKQTHIHLAVCLCIVDQLPHENIWKRWMEHNNGNDDDISSGNKNGTHASVSAELYIHAKHPEMIRSPWARSKLISKTYRPNWNDVRIVRAMLQLMKESLHHPGTPPPPSTLPTVATTESSVGRKQKDTERILSTTKKNKAATTHILFGTESCIPICELHELSPCLLPGVSYVKYYGGDGLPGSKGNNKQRGISRFDEQSVWNVLQKEGIPSNAIHKALPGWCVLSASHAQDILDIPDQHLQGQELWPVFQNVWAPEEVFFPTALALLGILHHHHDDGDGKSETIIKNQSLTFCQWNERARNEKDRAHPKFWDDEFDTELVLYLKENHASMFLRKVKCTMPLYRWERAVGSSETNRNTPTLPSFPESSLSRPHHGDAGSSRRGNDYHHNSNRNPQRGEKRKQYSRDYHRHSKSSYEECGSNYNNSNHRHYQRYKDDSHDSRYHR